MGSIESQMRMKGRDLQRFRKARERLPQRAGHALVKPGRNRLVLPLLLGASLCFGIVSLGHAQESAMFNLTVLDPPVGLNAREPSLAILKDGRIVLSWTEEIGTDTAVRMAVLDDDQWSPARSIHQSASMFVNWADFPSVVALTNGTLAAHWLELNGTDDYQYDVNIAFSSDEGLNWTAPIIPHDDRSQREHGFVSLVPDQSGGLTALWLDGRAYDSQAIDDSFENAMQVRARRISPDGSMGPESLLDLRACTCCQTSAVHNEAGDIIAVYRDRTAEEIRDISVVRLTEGGWTLPKSIHSDAWEIAGCPVNGPAVDALGTNAAVVWFTGANGDAKVRIAFSKDGGGSFEKPLPLDLESPAGRVDVLLMPDGTALALWLEYANNGEAIVMCRVSPESGCSSPQALHINRGRESVGFPRMTRSAAGVLVAWTGTAAGNLAGTTVLGVEVTIQPVARNLQG
jgi:hypothetical protein